MKRKNTFDLIVNVLTLMIISVGATFAYFSATSSSNENSVSLASSSFKVDLSVNTEYVGFHIIPLNDSQILTAYNNECKDTIGNGACNSYTINISNLGSQQDISAVISFSLTGFQNLSYIILDENGNTYKDVTKITTSGDYSLGDSFTIATNETKKFTLIIWLTNLEEPQNDTDAGGTYSASIAINSTNGDKLSGSILGNY